MSRTWWRLDVLQECPDEVFLEGILQPCLEQGRLGVLQGLLETLDATLESWGRYLIPACQMLQRKGHYHTLYQLQQFMMVLNTHLNRSIIINMILSRYK